MTEQEPKSECPDCHGEGGWHGEFYIWNWCIKCDGKGYLIVEDKPCKVKEERDVNFNS